jgi:hypothetical protein
MTAFVLQFPIEEARAYAERFGSAYDDRGLALARAARERGHYTRDEFLAVCRWKSARPGRRQQTNTAQAVEDATRIALADESSERERMDALLSLDGVGWPTASVLLHLAYPERYPILDWRALHALGVNKPGAYSFRFWEAYVTSWVPLMEQSGLDGRTFDQALWQWSKEQSMPR